MPILSVIVPVYNTEKYLEKSIKSIIKSKFKDLEIIIVNDGSTDNSEEIIKEIIEENKDFKIKYLKKENGGLSDARNYAIPYANGKYISFVDSDDYIDENLYLNLIEQLLLLFLHLKILFFYLNILDHFLGI